LDNMSGEDRSNLTGAGALYVHNKETGEIKRIAPDELFEHPWALGNGKSHNKNTRYMYRPGIDEKSKRVKESEIDDHLKAGYIFGMIKK